MELCFGNKTKSLSRTKLNSTCQVPCAPQRPMELKSLPCPGSCNPGLTNVTQVDECRSPPTAPAHQRPHSSKIPSQQSKNRIPSWAKLKIIPTMSFNSWSQIPLKFMRKTYSSSLQFSKVHLILILSSTLDPSLPLQCHWTLERSLPPHDLGFVPTLHQCP